MSKFYHIIISKVDGNDNMESPVKSIHGTDKAKCIDAAIKWIKEPAMKFLTFQLETNKSIYESMPYQHNQDSVKKWENIIENIDKDLEDVAKQLDMCCVKADYDETPSEMLAEVDFGWHKFYVYELQ